jgi:hypothetical protein
VRRIKEILDKDLRPDFKLELYLFDSNESVVNEKSSIVSNISNATSNIHISHNVKVNFELAKFISLLIYYQVIENAECEAKIINNQYEAGYADILRYFSGQDDRFEITNNNIQMNNNN